MDKDLTIQHNDRYTGHIRSIYAVDSQLTTPEFYIWVYVAWHWQRHGYGVTARDVGHWYGKTIRTATNRLVSLKRKGYVDFATLGRTPYYRPTHMPPKQYIAQCQAWGMTKL